MLQFRSFVSGISGKCFVLAVCCLSLSGCSETTLEYTEIKRPHEKITEEEFQTFLRIIDTLPDKKLPEFTPVYAPPPSWTDTRTLPVKDLVSEAEAELKDRWDVEWVSRQIKRDRNLQRTLRREKMTTDQFVGLFLAVGIAVNRNTIRENQDLNKIIQTGDENVKALKTITELYHKLNSENKHSLLKKAVWITRTDRARRLDEVPPENMEIAHAHQELLSQVFPSYFSRNPLDELTDRLDEFGIPFEEVAETGIDELRSWEKEKSIIGYDRPDSEFSPRSVPVKTETPLPSENPSPNNAN